MQGTLSNKLKPPTLGLEEEIWFATAGRLILGESVDIGVIWG